ncbi:MAG: hypothetical protein ABH830_02685 [Patescibacteria group bacterium]
MKKILKLMFIFLIIPIMLSGCSADNFSKQNFLSGVNNKSENNNSIVANDKNDYNKIISLLKKNNLRYAIVQTLLQKDNSGNIQLIDKDGGIKFLFKNDLGEGQGELGNYPLYDSALYEINPHNLGIAPDNSYIVYQNTKADKYEFYDLSTLLNIKTSTIWQKFKDDYLKKNSRIYVSNFLFWTQRRYEGADCIRQLFYPKGDKYVKLGTLDNFFSNSKVIKEKEIQFYETADPAEWENICDPKVKQYLFGIKTGDGVEDKILCDAAWSLNENSFIFRKCDQTQAPSYVKSKEIWSVNMENKEVKKVTDKLVNDESSKIVFSIKSNLLVVERMDGVYLLDISPSKITEEKILSNNIKLISIVK